LHGRRAGLRRGEGGGGADPSGDVAAVVQQQFDVGVSKAHRRRRASRQDLSSCPTGRVSRGSRSWLRSGQPRRSRGQTRRGLVERLSLSPRSGLPGTRATLSRWYPRKGYFSTPGGATYRVGRFLTLFTRDYQLSPPPRPSWLWAGQDARLDYSAYTLIDQEG